MMCGARLVVLPAIILGVAVQSAGATEVMKPPFLIHPDDAFVYIPQDASFLDSDHLMVLYTRGTQEEPAGTAGSFVRIYNLDDETFTPPLRLDASTSSNFAGGKLDGSNGRGRAVWLETGTDLLPGDVLERAVMLASVGADGELSGTPTQVSPDDTRAGSADVAVRSDGVTLVVWWELQDTSRRLKIFGRYYSTSLAPLGGEFVIFDAIGSFPRVAAGPSNFSVAFRGSVANSTILVALDHQGNQLWSHPFIEGGGNRPTVTVLSNGHVYLGYDRGSDAFVQLSHPLIS